MRFVRRVALLACAVAFASPAIAFASDGAQTTSTLRVAVDAIALAVAIALLLDVLALRRVAEGALFGENLILVLVGVICLSAAVLAGWVRIYAGSEAAEQLSLLADILVLACMVLLGVYFFRVRRALLRFVRAYPAAETDPADALVRSQMEDTEESRPDA